MIANLRAWTKDTVGARQGKATYTYEVAGVGVYRVGPVFTRAHEWAKWEFVGYQAQWNTFEPLPNGRHWEQVAKAVADVREGVAACVKHFNAQHDDLKGAR